MVAHNCPLIVHRNDLMKPNHLKDIKEIIPTLDCPNRLFIMTTMRIVAFFLDYNDYTVENAVIEPASRKVP